MLYGIMSSSGTLCHALVWTDVSEEHITSIIRVKRNSKLGRTLSVTSNWSMLQATRHHIPEDTILHSHRHVNIKSYIMLFSLVDGYQSIRWLYQIKGWTLLALSPQSLIFDLLCVLGYTIIAVPHFWQRAVLYVMESYISQEPIYQCT
jgi:hypothetical protein